MSIELSNLALDHENKGEETINELRRKLKSNSLQFKNEKLLLEHKNDLLKQELLELKEREINQAKLHESMFKKGNFLLSHRMLTYFE